MSGCFKSALIFGIDRRPGPSNLAALNADSITPDPEWSERAGVIDVVAHDPKADQAVLVMKESRPWDGSDDRLRDLQERFNCYVSFLLDGEFAEWNPQLAQKRARIELRCIHMPDPRTIDLLGKIRAQLAHQDIDVEVVVRAKP